LNLPKTEFPPIPLGISRYLDDPRIKFDKPRGLLSGIRKVRISTKKFRHDDMLIYPEFQLRGKWFIFRKDDKPLIFRIKFRAVMGISFNNMPLRIEKVKKELFKWLKEWKKLTHQPVELEELLFERLKEIPEIKKNRKRCICGARIENPDKCPYCKRDLKKISTEEDLLLDLPDEKVVQNVTIE
jgi:hypothetical protein